MITKPDFVEKKLIMVYPQDGEKISFKNDNIIVETSNGNIKFQLSCYRLIAVYIVGGFTLTSGIIEKSKNFGFSILMFSYSFKLYASINYKMDGNTLLRKKQYVSQLGNAISKEIIINKLYSQIYILEKLRTKEAKEGENILLANIEKLANNAITDEGIMGIEGICAKVYFNRIFSEMNWKGRQPRLKRDTTNLLLDIGYTILFNYIEGILNFYGFDIYKGNLHKEFFKRKSLVCDMIEPFRPIIDYKIRKMNNLGQLRNYNFKIVNSQYSLDWKDSKRFTLEILGEINAFKEEIFDFIQSYYRWFMKQGKIEDFPKVRLSNDTN